MSSPPHPPSARPVGRPAVRSVRYNPLKTPPPQYTVDLEADNISPCVHLLLETYIYDFANIDDGAPKQSSRCRALVEDAVDALLLVFDFLDGDYDAKSFIRYLCKQVYHYFMRRLPPRSDTPIRPGRPAGELWIPGMGRKMSQAEKSSFRDRTGPTPTYINFPTPRQYQPVSAKPSARPEPSHSHRHYTTSPPTHPLYLASHIDPNPRLHTAPTSASSITSSSELCSGPPLVSAPPRGFVTRVDAVPVHCPTPRLPYGHRPVSSTSFYDARRPSPHPPAAISRASTPPACQRSAVTSNTSPLDSLSLTTLGLRPPSPKAISAPKGKNWKGWVLLDRNPAPSSKAVDIVVEIPGPRRTRSGRVRS